MTRIAYCPACSAQKHGIKSRVAIEHTCGLETGAINPSIHQTPSTMQKESTQPTKPEPREVTAQSYTLRDDKGVWLGQVVLTSDGMFASVTDWGNLSFAWRNYGLEGFKQFLCDLDVDYFGTKMYTGMSYILHGRKCEKACERYAEKILPALQKILREELKTTTNGE